MVSLENVGVFGCLLGFSGMLCVSKASSIPNIAKENGGSRVPNAC